MPDRSRIFWILRPAPCFAFWLAVVLGGGSPDCLPLAAAQDATFKFDVVRLLESGQQTVGDEAFSSVHHGLRYWFADAEAKRAFDADPSRYAAQMDGACARMGSLAGRGRTDLFLVHNGHLFLFASQACRARFQKRPDEFVEQDDPIPEFTEAMRRRGQDLLRELVTAMGGAARIDAIQSYRKSYHRTFQSGGGDYDHRYTFTTDFSGRIRETDVYNNVAYSRVLNGKDSFFQDGDIVRPMYGAGRREMQRLANRDLLMIIKSRGREDFVVAAEESASREAPIPLTVAFDHTLTQILLDSTTRLPVALEYRGRGPDAAYTQTRHVFDRYGHVQGVLLPQMSHFSFDGKTPPDAARTWQYAINPPLTDSSFRPDK